MPVRCQVHRPMAAVITAPHRVAAITVLLPVGDRTEAIPEAGLLTMDTLHLGMTIITDRFSPRFTSHLTHRQEASEGASCPPRRVGVGEEISQDVLVDTTKLSDLGVESIQVRIESNYWNATSEELSPCEINLSSPLP